MHNGKWDFYYKSGSTECLGRIERTMSVWAREQVETCRVSRSYQNHLGKWDTWVGYGSKEASRKGSSMVDKRWTRRDSAITYALIFSYPLPLKNAAFVHNHKLKYIIKMLLCQKKKKKGVPNHPIQKSTAVTLLSLSSYLPLFSTLVLSTTWNGFFFSFFIHEILISMQALSCCVLLFVFSVTYPSQS